MPLNGNASRRRRNAVRGEARLGPCARRSAGPVVAWLRGILAVIAAEPYPFDLDPAHAGLVIIDMQRDFLEPGGFGAALGNDVSLLRRTIAPTRRLLDRARAVGPNVIHTPRGPSP
jgi:Isochorismatase family